MVTKINQPNRRQIREFPVPWRPWDFEYNTIRISGIIVRVYSNQWYHKGVIPKVRPDRAFWDGSDLCLTFLDGTIQKIADDGCWGPEYVGCRLIIQGNDILVYNGKGDYLTIHNERPVLKTQWFVYGGRHVVWVGLVNEGRYFSSPGVYEHQITGREMMDHTNELNAKDNGVQKLTETELPKFPYRGILRLGE